MIDLLLILIAKYVSLKASRALRKQVRVMVKGLASAIDSVWYILLLLVMLG